MAVTKLNNLINPEVMGDMISAKLPNKLVVAKIAKVDTTLQGVPGSTITVPKYGYIGDAEDVAEGVSVESVQLSTTTTNATIKKAVKSVDLTDESVLSGYGNPVAETNNQLAKSLASKVDSDCLEALKGATFVHNAESEISYDGIVEAIDLFDEEVNTEKVMFINPKQVTTLRKDENFISADKYTGDVIMTGEIGKIVNTRIVATKKVKLSGDVYACPIVKLEQDNETEDEVPALTIYLKRNVEVEEERDTKAGITSITANEHYVAVLSNDAKVVVAKFKAEISA